MVEGRLLMVARETQEPVERRSEERSDCALAGKIETREGAIDCVVTDLSISGARLRIDPVAMLPEAFDLLVPVVPGTDQRIGAKLIWRQGGDAGAQFLGHARDDAADGQ